MKCMGGEPWRNLVNGTAEGGRNRESMTEYTFDAKQKMGELQRSGTGRRRY